jgi:hypothetical protein
MRIAKLSDNEFPDVAALDAFFAGLPNRNPPGLFLIPAGQIRAGGLAVNEWVLFTFLARLRYVARAASGRQANTFEPRQDFPYCFIVNLSSIRPVDLPLSELEQRFRAAGVSRALAGRGWTEIDSAAADQVIAELVGGA